MSRGVMRCSVCKGGCYIRKADAGFYLSATYILSQDLVKHAAVVQLRLVILNGRAEGVCLPVTPSVSTLVESRVY